MDQKPPLSGGVQSKPKNGTIANDSGSAAATAPAVKVKKRRHRRTAAEIERTHACTYPGCTKAYGSESSLNQHIRLKHSKVSSPSPKRFGGFPMGMGMFPMGMYQLPGAAPGAPACGIGGQPLFPTAAGAPRPNKKLKSPDCSPLLLPKPPPNMQIPNMDLNSMEGSHKQMQQMASHQMLISSLQQQFMQQASLKDFHTPLVGPMEKAEPGSIEPQSISPPAFSLGVNAFTLGEPAIKKDGAVNSVPKHGSMTRNKGADGTNGTGVSASQESQPVSGTGLQILTGGSPPRKNGRVEDERYKGTSFFSPATSPVTTPTFDSDFMAVFGGLATSNENGPKSSAAPRTPRSEHGRALSSTSPLELLKEDFNVRDNDLLEWTKSIFPMDELGEDQAFDKAMAALSAPEPKISKGQGLTLTPRGNDNNEMDLGALQF